MNKLDSSIPVWRDKYTHRMHYFSACTKWLRIRDGLTIAVHLHYSTALTEEVSSQFVDDGHLNASTLLTSFILKGRWQESRMQKQYVLCMCFHTLNTILRAGIPFCYMRRERSEKRTNGEEQPLRLPR
jgi:hypothetical protein